MPVTVNYCLSRNSVCCGSRKRRLPRFALVTVLALLLGTETLSAADSDQADGCEESDNLLLDPAFLMSGDMSRIWRYSQHTGEKSFSYSSDEGILQLERISEQPWMILKQRISNPRLSGARVRFSAKLKGDLPTEPPIHGFEHKAGLYFKARGARGELAEHPSNHGSFDWQLAVLDRTLPQGAKRLDVGFVHQAGGTLWASEPALVIVKCDE